MLGPGPPHTPPSSWSICRWLQEGHTARQHARDRPYSGAHCRRPCPAAWRPAITSMQSRTHVGGACSTRQPRAVGQGGQLPAGREAPPAPLTRCCPFPDAGWPVRVRPTATEGQRGGLVAAPPPALRCRAAWPPRKLPLSERPARPSRPAPCSNQIGAKFWEVRWQQRAVLGRRRHVVPAAPTAADRPFVPCFAYSCTAGGVR